MASLVECLPETYERYIEPFAGSACIFFATGSKEAILGDFNYELINFYEELKLRPQTLYAFFSQWDHSKEQYYELRSQIAERLEPSERAARFFYLNRYCFNGVYRTNKKGHFNVPFGKSTGSAPTEEELLQCSHLLQKATLVNADFEECIALAKPNDIVYLDPPYTSTERNTIGEYGPDAFSKHDEERLLASLERLDARSIRFMLSYADTPNFRKLLQADWTIRSYQVIRNVSGFHSRRRQASELLVTNY